MPTPTFWTEPSGRVRLKLRRFVFADHDDDSGSCPDRTGYHNATVPVGEAPERRQENNILGLFEPSEFADDFRWPTKCDACDYVFNDKDEWQVFQETIYRRPDTDGEWPQRLLPPGAMYDASWLPDNWKGADGIGLAVLLPVAPDHAWLVDVEASNCTRKGDFSHKCWIRHGDPRTEPVTVDKNGDTCAAGAGSIAVEGYHGFLQNGVLTDG